MSYGTAGTEPAGVGARWSAVRRFAGYGAAATLSLYLVVKVIWVLAALTGGGASGAGNWVALNAVTVGMAAVGIALGLALAQPWGRRIPAAPLLLAAWTGAGFLVPMLPYLVANAVLGAAGAGGAEGSASGGVVAIPAWEGVFITIGFAGMAAGLAAGLPIYMRERWPHAFLGRLGDGPGPPRSPYATRVAAAVAFALGSSWLYWALGGTLGLAPAHRGMGVNERLLSGNWALWAFAGAWSIWVITSPRHTGRTPVWVPLSLAFTASGSLFAWGCWKLSVAVLRPVGYVPEEHPVVAVVQHALAIGAGAAMMAGIVRTCRERAAGRVSPRR
ncbi:hypothetical protein ACLQ2R_22405 [Streptosporangium sp. DT93]|uniref:hypothetical protein n=1 Tax=Streptosporangium sp. DT93 TaxID=3393428 RepID=UPI003CED3F1D